MGLFRTLSRKMRQNKYGGHRVSLSELGAISEPGESSKATPGTSDASDTEGVSDGDEERDLPTPRPMATVITPARSPDRPHVTSSRPHARIEKAFKALEEHSSNAS